MVLGKPKLSCCDIGFAQIQVWSHIHFLGSLVFHTFIGASFTGRGHFQACCLAKTACWWAANVHQRPSALSSSKTGWPSGAWDRELGSLEGCTGSNCLGAKHATGRSPILLLPARHAACGGRRNRKRGIRVVTKKIAHTTREEGDLAIYCVITGTDSLNWPWLTVLPTEPKLLYCLFAPTTGPHHC